MVVKCDNCGNRYEWDKSNKCPYCGFEYNKDKERFRIGIMIFLSIPAFVLLTSIPEILDRYFFNPNKYEAVTKTQWMYIVLVLLFVLSASLINAFRFLEYIRTKEATHEKNKN